MAYNDAAKMAYTHVNNIMISKINWLASYIYCQCYLMGNKPTQTLLNKCATCKKYKCSSDKYCKTKNVHRNFMKLQKNRDNTIVKGTKCQFKKHTRQWAKKEGDRKEWKLQPVIENNVSSSMLNC